MKALVKEGRSVALIDVPPPALRHPDDVIVEVICAGICRTDLHVATGAIASADPITLGHELCGRVIACGPAARVAIGDLVSADPRIDGGFLGITHHGAFAERVLLPGANVWKLPDVDPRAGAYLEPIASALAVAHNRMVDHDRDLRWVVARRDRFSQLICEVLRVARLGEPGDLRDARIERDPESTDLLLRVGADRRRSRVDFLDDRIESDSYDVAVDTSGSERELAMLIDALRPGGVLILKRRHSQPVPLPIGRIVAKEVVVAGALYGELSRAIDMLGALELGDLLGDSYPLARFEDAFAAAAASEARKVFLTCAA